MITFTYLQELFTIVYNSLIIKEYGISLSFWHNILQGSNRIELKESRLYPDMAVN